jgi:sulfate adenylyltransferase
MNIMDKILDEREICDLECLLLGAFSPLNTYMTMNQYNSCLDNMRIDSSVFSIPITCSIGAEVSTGTVICLKSITGVIYADLTVSECWPINIERECLYVFGCFDKNHPYIQYMSCKSDKFYVSGKLDFKYNISYHNTFSAFRKTPEQVKAMVSESGKPLIGFQTRNPLHRSHIELIKASVARVPGAAVMLHPVEGVTQECDIPFPVRMKCYNEVLPELPSCTLSILPLSMRMAGPREAVWHAVIRRNYGCTHFIVGRDHAGPSYKKEDGTAFFDPMEAQRLALSLANDIGIIILASQEVVYVDGNGGCYMEAGAATKAAENGCTIKNISGTAFRSMLQSGIDIPSWYSYTGVVKVLQHFYNRPRGACYYFVGLSGAGKSTLAEILNARLEEKYPHREVTVLDADVIRTHLSKGLGFSREDRSMNVRRIGYVASEIVRHGGLVIVANIAPFAEDRAFNKKLITAYGDYYQIFVDTPVTECERRDVKGLYAAARAGTVKNFTGVSDPFEIPEDSFMTLTLASVSETAEIMFKGLNI